MDINRIVSGLSSDYVAHCCALVGNNPKDLIRSEIDSYEVRRGVQPVAFGAGPEHAGNFGGNTPWDEYSGGDRVHFLSDLRRDVASRVEPDIFPVDTLDLRQRLIIFQLLFGDR